MTVWKGIKLCPVLSTEAKERIACTHDCGEHGIYCRFHDSNPRCQVHPDGNCPDGGACR